jgi:hypothetical protein
MRYATKQDAQTAANSFRSWAKAIRDLAETPRYRRYAIAHRQAADHAEQQAAEIEREAGIA